MRITDISVFLFCFLTLGGAFTAAVPDIFGGPNPIAIDSTNIQINATEEVSNLNLPNLTSTYGWVNMSYYQAIVLGGVTTITGGLNILLKIFAPALNLGGILYDAIPFLPVEFCGAITSIVYVIYALGIAQWWSGRSEKLMR
jgi:hypothetical protein